MHWESSTTSIETGSNGLHVATIGIAPRAVLLNGYYRPIISDWANGDAGYPDVVTIAPLAVRSASNGRYRIYPVPGDATRYLELARPYVKPAGSWQPLPLGSKTRTGNRLSWSGANVDLTVTHGGHFIDWQMPLKSGYIPPSRQLAVPVSLVGLTRQGANILADGKPVMRLRPPMVHDADNLMDVRPVKWDFGAIGGQTGVLLTLPDLAGMRRPVVDPTWSSQPGAAEGKDTYIAPFYPDRNYGAGIAIRFDTNPANLERALMAFNVSGAPFVPAGIQSVTVALYNLGAVAAATVTVQLYEIAVGNQAWPEGAQLGVTPPVGEDGCTWASFNHNGLVAWAGSAGLSTAGTDYINTVLGTVTDIPGNVAGWHTWGSSAALVSAVAAWKTNTSNNNGLLFIGAGSGGEPFFATSDSLTAAWRPLLEVVYSLANGIIGRGRVPALSRMGAMR